MAYGRMVNGHTSNAGPFQPLFPPVCFVVMSTAMILRYTQQQYRDHGQAFEPTQRRARLVEHGYTSKPRWHIHYLDGLGLSLEPVKLSKSARPSVGVDGGGPKVTVSYRGAGSSRYRKRPLLMLLCLACFSNVQPRPVLSAIYVL